MQELDYTVGVAIRGDLTVDQRGEAMRLAELKSLQIVDQDTYKGWGMADKRDIWTITGVLAVSQAAAMAMGARIVTDLFTEVDPQAEAVGAVATGEH